MPPKRKAETVQVKSAAEFFTENQNIAGFDNPGKSLFTTIRELVENSLDAAESVGASPEIEVTVEELSQASVDAERGVVAGERVDLGLFEAAAAGKKNGKKTKSQQHQHEGTEEGNNTKGGRKQQSYYRVTCRDNGCGMKAEVIPEALGRVLAGSKYGVRQTRGKFGLGAKMALIWAKKSTGAPVVCRSSTGGNARVTRVVLDIDVRKNEPKVLEQATEANPEAWRGTELVVTVGGAWSAYKARITTYLQQLAIITPYARFDFRFVGGARSLVLRFEPRSDKVPAPPERAKYHPWALNELSLHQLLERSEAKTLQNFFVAGEIAAVDAQLAARLVAELDARASLWSPADVAADARRVAKLSRLLRDTTVFAPPDGRKCLSPVGEYNLRLGVAKELTPDFVATYALPRASSYEGHPFLVEAAVSIGGGSSSNGGGGDDAAGPGAASASSSAAETLTIHRFANRIPLLFEAGADVVTRVAKTKIKWSSYKIDVKRDRVGVFVSLVSTKVPFKGTSKEYIGEDATEIHDAVKTALQHCCVKLKAHLTRRDQERRGKDRKKVLLRYAPDVARAFCAVFDTMRRDPDGDLSGGRRTALLRRLDAASSNKPIDQQLVVDRLKVAVDKAADDDADADAPAQEDEQRAARVDAVRIDLRRTVAAFTFRTPLFVFEAGAQAVDRPDDVVKTPRLPQKRPVVVVDTTDDDVPGGGSDDDDDDDDVGLLLPRKTSALPPAKKKAKTTPVRTEDDDVEESPSSDDPPRRPPSSRAKRSRPPPAVLEIDDDDDDDEARSSAGEDEDAEDDDSDFLGD